MNRGRRQIIWFVISLALALVFAWLAFAGQDLDALRQTLGRTRWAYIGLALVLTFGGHWARARRWKLLLSGTGNEVRTRDALLSLLNGYFVNLGVPRLGEITRCGVLHRLSGAPVFSIAGTVVAERAVDVLVLLLISLVFFLSAGGELLAQFDLLILQPISSSLHARSGMLVPVGMVALVGLVVLFFLAKKGRNDAKTGIFNHVARWSHHLWQGLVSAFRLRQRGGFVLLTAVIWISYFSAPLLSLYALDLVREDVLTVAFAAFLFGSLARTVPLPAGSAGAYHFLVSTVLLIWGYTEGEGLSLATLNHGVQTAFYLLAGLISWAVLVSLQRGIESRK
jgi:hypothetical protein